MHHAVRSPSTTGRGGDLRPAHPAARRPAGRASRSTRSRRAGLGLAFALLLPPLALASCTLPAVQSSDVSQGELMLELSDALAGMRSTDADLQEQVDSLRAVVARQDSLLARLAAATGVPLR